MNLEEALRLIALLRLDEDDKALLRVACRAKNGAKFIALFFGAHWMEYRDPATAAMAVLAMLSFYCRRDPDQMARLFVRSKCFRRGMNVEVMVQRVIADAIEKRWPIYAEGYWGKGRNAKDLKFDECGKVVGVVISLDDLDFLIHWGPPNTPRWWVDIALHLMKVSPRNAGRRFDAAVSEGLLE
jgi:hypothetical protein